MNKCYIKIESQPRSSVILCGENIAGKYLKETLGKDITSIFIVADANVLALHKARISKLLQRNVPIYKFPSGEKHKSEKNLHTLLDWLHSQHADRKSLIIAVGGGVVTDIAGFAAACYMRGIDYVSVPTTLVGQVDAAIGGKTAINFRGTKNIVGAFHLPKMVICDTEFLTTLKPHQIKDGLVEAYKMFTAYNEQLFRKHLSKLSNFLDGENLAGLVTDAVRLKAKVVNIDPYENGLRRVLNFGHTTGHAVEMLTGWSHGKSVAFGILVALSLSTKLSGLNKGEAERIEKCFLSIYSRFDTSRLDPRKIWQLILHDKKRVGHSINFVLLKKCGSHAIKTVNYRQFERAFHDTLERMKS